MTIMELERHIESYGLDFARWPDPLAEQALDLLRTSEAAQDLYARATAFDEDFLGGKGDTADLARRIADGLDGE
ncbi:MAG: hypothetical protein KA105_07540 [Caulobacter sp.]|jgi:hypothetical protein|nr:hypothetical protein [Caulobacter sp.]